MEKHTRYFEGCGREGPINCIFLTEFHHTAGPKITCQVGVSQWSTVHLKIHRSLSIIGDWPAKRWICQLCPKQPRLCTVPIAYVFLQRFYYFVLIKA